MLVVHPPQGTSYRRANHMKAMGYTPGTPDLLVLEEGADGALGLAVEFKIGAHKLSPDQRGWFERAMKKRWRCGVARSVGEFKTLVCGHLGEA